MPNRYVRESAIESERVNALSWLGEVFFRRLINKVDDFGRFSSNPALLRAALFPLRLDEVSESVTSECVQELVNTGLAFTYEVDGKRVIQLEKWEKGRAKESKYPDPPADISQRLQTFVYNGKQVQTNVPDSDSDSDSDSESDPGGKSPALEIAEKEIAEIQPFRSNRHSAPEGKEPADRWNAIVDFLEVEYAEKLRTDRDSTVRSTQRFFLYFEEDEWASCKNWRKRLQRWLFDDAQPKGRKAV